MTDQYNFDWSEMAFSSKKPLRDLRAAFIAAPREISTERFTQLVKEWLPKGNIVLGLAKEDYINGFDRQPQFWTLKLAHVQAVIDKVNASKNPHKIYTLHYFQRDLNHIIEKLTFKQYLFISGSWHKAFHNLAPYYTLAKKQLPYELISPFTDEREARQYTNKIEKEIKAARPLPKSGTILSEASMVETSFNAAAYSFDYNFQTGVALGKANKGGYKFLAASHNAVVPFQAYAMHYGAAREIHFSPPHDVNHYDTVHAEVELILAAAKDGISLKGTSFFINTLPCPTCSRMLSQTDIKEFIYQNDHSEGYAIAMFEAAGKTVRRLAPPYLISDI